MPSTLPSPASQVLPCSRLVAVSPELPLDRHLPSSTHQSSPGLWRLDPAPRTRPLTCSRRGGSQRWSPEPGALCELVTSDTVCVPPPRIKPIYHLLQPSRHLQALSSGPAQSLCPHQALSVHCLTWRGRTGPLPCTTRPWAGAQGVLEAALTWLVEKAPELILHIGLTLLQVLLLEAGGWE